MSEVFSAMNDAQNNNEITTENQIRKSANIEYINRNPRVDNSAQGYQSASVSSVPTTSEQATFNQSQAVYSNQLSSFGSNVEFNQTGTRSETSNSSNLDQDQYLMRQPLSSNFQHSYNPVQMNSGLGLNNQPPLLSNGNYSTLKNMHHGLTTTEAFVSMQPSNIGHSQFQTNSLPANSNNNPSQSHSQIPASHGISLGSDMMVPRNNASSSHAIGGIHQIQADNSASAHSGNLSNPYVPVNRSVGVIAQNHSIHSSVPTISTSQNYQLNSHSNLHYPVGPSNSNFQGSNISRSSSSKNWHSADHGQLRESVAEEIVKILKSRKPNAGDGWHDKLPHMAKRLEDALYQDAATYDEYADRNTLKHRLQQLALTMGSKSQSKSSSLNQSQNSALGMSNPSFPAPQAHPQHVVRQPQSSSNYSLGYPQNVPSQPQLHLSQQNPSQQMATQYVNYHPSQQLSRNSQIPFGAMNSGLHQVGSMSLQTAYPSVPPDYSNQNSLRNIPPNSVPMIPQNQSYISGEPNNLIDGGFNRNYGMQSNTNQIVGYKAPEDGSHFNSVGRIAPILSQGNIPNSNLGGIGLNGNVTGSHSIPGNNQNSDEHRKQVLKQQQQRLLLLRHASKCPHENGRCPVTPHCWNMKQLWKHIMSCKDQDCKVAHCVSSRYVLSHYSKCKEPTCPVCGPVREAIKRNYERSRDVVKSTRNLHVSNLPSSSQISSLAGNPSLNSNSAVTSVSKGDEPEKKKIRRKSDATVMNSSQINQPLVIRQPPRKIYPLDPISSAIYSFTNDQIQAHFRTIHEGLRLTVSKIREMCKPILEDLLRIPHTQGVFGSPVDPIALGLVDYLDVVKAPMDLGTIMKKLENGSYRDIQNFVSDVHLTFDNAMLYNPKNTDVYLLASNLKKEFDKKYRSRLADFDKQIEENRKNRDACLICGEITLKYEPPVYYCNGTCAQRIRRNAVFYSNNSNTYHWCSVCFNTMKESDSIRLPDCIITKAELAANKKKHIEESGEGWVECEGGCKRWVHQICSLFNNRRNVSDDVSYVCPLCLQEKRRKSPNEEIVAMTSKKMKAVDLPITTLSDFLEKRILKRLELAYEETATKYNLELSGVERCPPLTLRQVSCVDKLQPVRDGFLQRYKDKGYPTDFPCRSKCLVLFQNIDGQDVILFGMYVYEYGHKCPQPNQRRVYISYLDSVHYLRPKQYRTLVYHEILISYLDYVKARGFHTVHIWACPPQKGDDYILYVHPQDQKTPKPQILRLWYDEMLKRCMERGIVCEMSDLHTEYLADVNTEATALPYFEGDYWVNEAEVIIKNLVDGRKDDNLYDDVGGSKSKRRSKSKRPGVVSSGGTSNTGRDPLMAKLASIIEPMKDTFFVARLHPKEFVEKVSNSNQGNGGVEEINKEKTDEELQEEALSGQDIVPQLPELQATNSSKGTKRPRDEDDSSQRETMNEEDDSEDDFLKNATYITSNSAGKEASADLSIAASAVEEEQLTTESSQPILSRTESSEYVEQNFLETKETSETSPKIVSKNVFEGSVGKKMIPCGEDMPSLPDDTEDVDDIQESEHFDTRQSFLNLCQGNHYQFDQLRRAKHSSMMVLYHLHNPDAPKFVPSCGSCHVDILTGTRYRCEKCELDYCQSCLSRIGSSIHNHPLRPMSGGNTAPTKLTEEQRRERQRSIQLHMQLLNHAANCIKCESRNCAKMKDFLLHESQCKIKSSGGCRLCSRISNLLNIHARSCRIENCKVPQCLKLREQFRQLALSQQRMDDRRRKKMNSEYNRGASENRAEDEEN